MDVLVVSAHPDDETIGCGGTLLAHRADGDDVHWLIVTKTQTPTWTLEVIHAKESEIAAVSGAYGFKHVYRLNFPSAELETIPLTRIVKETRGVIEATTPERVYVVHRGDVHTDHAVVFQAVTAVLRPARMRLLGTKRLLCFECASSTNEAPQTGDRVFRPNYFKDITPFVERKLEIMSLYATEVQSDPHPRGVGALRALARYRGSTIGVEYAEAFMTIHEWEP